MRRAVRVTCLMCGVIDVLPLESVQILSFTDLVEIWNPSFFQLSEGYYNIHGSHRLIKSHFSLKIAEKSVRVNSKFLNKYFTIPNISSCTHLTKNSQPLVILGTINNVSKS